MMPGGPIGRIPGQSILPQPCKPEKNGFSIHLLISVVALPDKRPPLNVHGHSCSILSPRVPHRGVRGPERSNSQSNPPSQPEQKGFKLKKY